jgi:general secretion pathway protein E
VNATPTLSEEHLLSARKNTQSWLKKLGLSAQQLQHHGVWLHCSKTPLDLRDQASSPDLEPTTLWLIPKGERDAAALELVCSAIQALQCKSSLKAYWGACDARVVIRLLATIEENKNPVSQNNSSQRLRELAEDQPVVELVQEVFDAAQQRRASDIHIHASDAEFVIRYRCDGKLQAEERYPKDMFDAVVSRIKLIAGLDIAERRLPQDGRLTQRAGDQEVDVRVSVIPAEGGESIVLRLLPTQNTDRAGLSQLGMRQQDIERYSRWMNYPDGIILITGPTGSGKSTTLYATLMASDRFQERVMTVEDPVEYQIPAVTQFAVNAEIGFTFPAALRAMLRHDPDTIMIGEIRDVETARIAVQASLTGHRVYSSLHTNDTATAFMRLSDMGIEPFLVGATLRGVVAQRLIRVLCTHCKRPNNDMSVQIKANNLIVKGEHPLSLYQPVGCAHCNGTGYRGRTAVYELLECTDGIRRVLGRANASLEEIRNNVQAGFTSLMQDALRKAAVGITSAEEAFALARPDEII